MHLLQVQPGEISDGSEPVDLGQTPADVIVVSAADTEIAGLSAAYAEMSDGPSSLRLANLGNFGHPFTVDKYLDDTATKAKLVVVRILGGEAYWQYGLEQFAIRLGALGIAFAALPGDDKPDETLRRYSSVTDEDYDALWSYLIEGGPQNSGNFLRYCRSMLDGSAKPEGAKLLLRAGIYWPGAENSTLDDLRQNYWVEGQTTVALVFYRALVQGGGLHPVNRLVKQLVRQGLNPLPIFVASLKDSVSAATLAQLFEQAPPDVVLNGTSFAVSSPQTGAEGHQPTPLDSTGAPVFQIVFAGGTEQAWLDGLNGLSARDIAMNVSLPEIDGRILTRAVSFKGEAYFDEKTECLVSSYRAHGERIAFVSELAANWAKLGTTSVENRKVALVLANYPNKDGRLANGVGLDTPAATVNTLHAMSVGGYDVQKPPKDSADLMAQIQAGPTNWLTDRAERKGGVLLPLDAYQEIYSTLPHDVRRRIEDRWGAPSDDPFFADGAFALSILEYGNLVVGVQPARGYNIDPKETYHSPDLVPPHNYLAFYFWLRGVFHANAIVHMGKHGNMEWLPGKAIALSNECLPEVVLGPTPHFYPFIVNDPGEGTQAKRRSQAVIIDHLTPPLTRAETYGPLKDLEALVDEYYEAAGVDPRRLEFLRKEILTLTQSTRIDEDAGIDPEADEDQKLMQLDEYLCDLKESQIRDGLHIFGTSPEGRLANDLIVALTRVPRGQGKNGDASLIRALARDLEISDGFDPLDCNMGAKWTGSKPQALMDVSDDVWRITGDTVERLEILASRLVAGQAVPANWPHTQSVINEIETRVRPAVTDCGPSEIQGLLTGLSGRFLPPGPSGAPTRGRLDTLPTGRNFYSIDSRTLPTPAAWQLGWKSACYLIDRHLQDEGDWPRSLVLSAWGTSNMRTGGDDIAQALALMGVRPEWDNASRRVTGFEIMPLDILDRPRVDVTMRISGFFRDAFPAQIDLLDSAMRAVMKLDEPDDMNPAAARYRKECETEGEAKAGYRIFGSKPGAYGAGLQALIDERIWKDTDDLADAYLTWGGYAYGSGAEGAAARDQLETRLSSVDAVVHNQDNREHDILDSDDYYQFEGGVAAAVKSLQGDTPTIYHNDHSRPERPVIRTLDEEMGRVIRSRVVNPKWIEGVKRHGYKGAFEMAATLDYMFAFAATTKAVKNHHFDLVHAAFIQDDDTREFIAEANPAALREMAERFQEAIDRGLWQPRSNSARAMLAGLLE